MTAPAGARVVHLTTGHQPEDARMYGRQCRTLAAAGYEVVIVAPTDEGVTLDGVRVVPIPIPSSRTVRMVVTPLQAWWAARRQRADIYQIHDANLLPLAIAMAITGSRVVYDAHEDVFLWAREADWIPAPVRRPAAWLVRAVERLAVRVCLAVISAEPAALPRFPADKVTLIQNFPRLEEFAPSSEASRDEPVCAYVGDITRERGIPTVVEAFGLLPSGLGARFELAGRITQPGLADELAALDGWSRVTARGWLSRAEVSELLASARMGVVTLLPKKLWMTAQPVKLFEYMAAGLPVVASDFPVWRRLLGDPPAGLLVDPSDPTAIAGAVEWLLTHPDEASEMGARGRRAVEERYRWDHEVPKLVDLYGRVTDGIARAQAGT